MLHVSYVRSSSEWPEIAKEFEGWAKNPVNTSYYAQIWPVIVKQGGRIEVYSPWGMVTTGPDGHTVARQRALETNDWERDNQEVHVSSATNLTNTLKPEACVHIMTPDEAMK